ncbi:hypothetical protein Trydic_g17854 [Trypoxylus dichotomus]
MWLAPLPESLKQAFLKVLNLSATQLEYSSTSLEIRHIKRLFSVDLPQWPVVLEDSVMRCQCKEKGDWEMISPVLGFAGENIARMGRSASLK